MFKISRITPSEYSGDLLVYLVRQPAKAAPKTPNPTVNKQLNLACRLGDFKGKEGETFLYYPGSVSKKNKTAGRVMVVGLGKDELSRELFREAGGYIAARVLKSNIAKIMVVVPEKLSFAKEEMVECLTEGLLLGTYGFKKYKTQKDDEDANQAELKEVVFSVTDSKNIRQAMKLGKIGATAATVARDMANEPGSHWTPTHFAEYGKTIAQKHNLSCKVLTLAQMKKLGMGGVIGVNQGSAQPPKMIILEHKASAKAKTLLLVGKGLTFDSGGISLKPSGGMEDMKYDMCGGAAVLATMQAVAEAKVKGLNVVAIVPATENLPGPSAIKPGDLIKQYGGKTVEVINTDAEGRLILADALAYGIKKFKPDMAVDVATLTGAVIIGLGHHRTGLLSNDDDLCDHLLDAGEHAGEPLWRLPLGKEYSKQIKSDIADIKNVGKRDGGTITAAAFLQEFVGKTPWAHLDIAGTAWNFTKKSYVPKGPSGIAVRTLFKLVQDIAKKK
jgi:leucyl aminopeptidase